MADEGDPEGLGNLEGDQERPRLEELEARVARLEYELDALRCRVADGGGMETAAARAVPVAPQVPAARTSPPPPPPVATAGAVTPERQRLVSEAWAAVPPRPHAPQAPESRDSLESRLGSQIFNRIAIVLLLIGTAYFLKLAIDRDWIGPTGQVLAVLLIGAALVLWSERFRHKGFAAFSYSMKAVGSGVLYLALWAAFQHFHLIPAGAAFALMLLVTAWNGYMAWAQDSQLLAAYALAGGFATPMLLSTGGNHEVFLFSYVLAIDLAVVALVRLRDWPRLLWGAFPLTVVYFVAWYVEFYRRDELGPTAIFVVLFWAAFASVPLQQAGKAKEAAGRGMVLRNILLPLASAAFVALAFFAVLQDSGHYDWLPWLMVALAATYLGIMRLPQTAVAAAIHLSISVVFLTIAIPLKASGQWITVSWLVEGLALLWVATRLAPAGAADEEPSDYAARTLRGLALASLLLGFCGVCVHLLGMAQEFDAPFLNKGTTTALIGVAAFAAAAWLALRMGASDAHSMRNKAWDQIAMGVVLLINVTAALLTVRELGTSWLTEYASSPHLAFRSGDFFTALMALAIFAGVVAVSLRVAKQRADEDFWSNCAALCTIAFNLIAVLTGVREIEAIWQGSSAGPDAALQQALAISAYLMLYGAALLAAGFWRRSGFLRWQALVLLVFTICKTFLYDMRNLSQGYRVVSFLGLGALLMAISFAYQKDWLNLRGAKGEAAGSEGTGNGAQGTDSGAAR